MTEQQKLDSLDRALDAMRREAVEVRRAVQQDRGWPVRYSTGARPV